MENSRAASVFSAQTLPPLAVELAYQTFFRDLQKQVVYFKLRADQYAAS